MNVVVENVVMTKLQLTDYSRGWVVGNFEPSIFKRDNFELSIKKYKKGNYEYPHTHKESTEYTVINSGKVKMNGEIFSEGDIIKIEPNEYTDFLCVEDTSTTVFRDKSIMNDKHYKQYHNISIVIQGLLSIETLESIDYLKEYFLLENIKVSTWTPKTEEDSRLLQQIKDKFKDGHNCVNNIIINNLPSVVNICNQQSIYYQMCSSLSGIYNCQTEYVIKIRSDEYAKNWKPFVEKLLSNPQKIITSSHLFYHMKRAGYHIGDHIIGGNIQDMTNLFFWTKYFCERNQQINGVEVSLYKNYLKYHKKETNLEGHENCRDLTRKYFDVVALESFEKYKFRYNDIKVVLTEETTDQKILDLFKDCIRSLDDLEFGKIT